MTAGGKESDMRSCDILPMAEEHLDQVAEIERQCFSDPWSRRMLSEHLANPCAAALVALDPQGAVLGYAGLLAVLDEGYITNVAVRSERRRRGVASALLAALDRLGEERRLAFLTLEVRASNAAARALYQRCGYAETGCRKQYYAHPREDAIIMTKEFAKHGAETADGQ